MLPKIDVMSIIDIAEKQYILFFCLKCYIHNPTPFYLERRGALKLLIQDENIFINFASIHAK